MELLDTETHDTDERSWNLSFLRSAFRERELDKLFEKYDRKVQDGYFSMFLLLQTVLNIVHISVLIAEAMQNQDTQKEDSIIIVLPDILCYSFIAILSTIALFIKEKKNKTYTLFPISITTLSIVLLLTCDLFVPIYHATYYVSKGHHIRPAYTTHLIIACYVFLPISDNFLAFIFGFSVTICHLITLGFVTYNGSPIESLYYRLGSDAFYLFCINALGLYFRFVNEILKRRTFLDRRACVQSTLKLKYEKEQEEQLMLSILPQHIAKRVRDDIMAVLENSESKVKYKPFKNLYIQKHENVTILFADIVNYTEMTRSLPVKILVETLNELFGKFDDASENRGVLRIKFLGDCYYCVSGLPEPNPDHAKSCVELGLDMISIIQEVRAKRNLNIDMRIGVHSGGLYSGLIGERKWQYDIWSNDVQIANHMESAGQAGKVHVTKQTLDLLKNQDKYDPIIPSNCSEKDQFLKNMNIEGFLISPETDKDPKTDNLIDQKSSVNGRFDRARRASSSVSKNYSPSNFKAISAGTAVSHRRSDFMGKGIQRLEKQLREIEESLEEAVEKMPLRKYEQWFKPKDINPFTLTFRNLKLELPYFMEPDPLFKYYLLSSLFILLIIFSIQNLTEFSLNWNNVWLVFVTLALLIFILLPLTWLYALYKKFFSKTVLDASKNYFLSFIKFSAGLVSTNVYLRVILYLTVSGLIATCTILDMVDCDQSDFRNKTTYYFDGKETILCLDPWHLSQTYCLAVVASFSFLRIYIGLKILYGIVITIVYTFYILNLKDFIENETWNMFMPPQIACILSLTFLILTFHLIDRQAEYLRRLDFQWKNQLISEKIEAEKMHKINNMLLNNILPMYVVEKYLSTSPNQQTDDAPFNEEYKSVAVMFASIIQCDFLNTTEIGDINNTEETLLTVMNEIISEFDMLLTKPCGEKVEKIKLAKWTYMAACGLDPGRKDSNTSVNKVGNDNIVVQMIRFAVNMMRVLKDIDSFQKEQFKLRIGISHGEVTAGVVGSKKPLYDIWGDTVNTASRMDTTGEVGKIQVTQHTAQVLQRQGIECTYRAETFVKGVGIIPTYFVDVDSQQSLTIIDNYNTKNTSTR